MNKGYLVLLALLACLTGCVPVDSLNPLYTGKDIVFDESLLGFWVGPDGGKEGGVEFSRLEEYGEKGYVVTIFTEGKKSPNDKMVFHARLVKIGKGHFLDMVASDWDAEPESFSLQIKSDKEGTKIEPALLKLGASSYLEFSAGMPADNGKVQATLRSVHWFAKVSKQDKKLRLDWADDDDFRIALQGGTVHLPSIILGEGKDQRVVITADTKELQDFVTEHVDDGTFFNRKTYELHRRR